MAKQKQKQKASSATQLSQTEAIKTKSSSSSKSSDGAFPKTLLRDNVNHQTLVLEDLIANAVFVAQNALSTKECDEWIKYAESTGTWDIVAHPATKWIAHRECSRLQKNDWTMAHRLFTRIQQIVVEASKKLDIFDKSSLINSSYANNKKYQPITCNPNLRLYKYTKGEKENYIWIAIVCYSISTIPTHSTQHVTHVKRAMVRAAHRRYKQNRMERSWYAIPSCWCCRNSNRDYRIILPIFMSWRCNTVSLA